MYVHPKSAREHPSFQKFRARRHHLHFQPFIYCTIIIYTYRTTRKAQYFCGDIMAAAAAVVVVALLSLSLSAFSTTFVHIYTHTYIHTRLSSPILVNCKLHSALRGESTARGVAVCGVQARQQQQCRK